MDTSYLLIIAILIGCLASTIPVFIALFFTGMVGLVFMIGIDPQIVIEVLYRSMDKFALIVVLFFVLCGNIMTTGSIVEKLIKTANVFVGFLPGGLAMAGVIACGFFGAISGSTVATVVAIGSFMIPALIENDYEEKFSVGLMTTAPILGVIVPPSIAMILYAMVSNDQLEALFFDRLYPRFDHHRGDEPLCLCLLQKIGDDPSSPTVIIRGRGGAEGIDLGAFSTGADLRRYLFRSVHCQRGGRRRLFLRLFCRDLHPS